MTDFFTRLAEHALGHKATIFPQITPKFSAPPELIGVQGAEVLPEESWESFNRRTSSPDLYNSSQLNFYQNAPEPLLETTLNSDVIEDIPTNFEQSKKKM